MESTSENPFLGSGSVYWGDPSIKGIYGARVFWSWGRAHETEVQRRNRSNGFFDLGVAPKKRRFSGETGAMPINLGYRLYNTAQSMHISLWTRWAIILCEKPLIDKTWIETQGQVCWHSLAICFGFLGYYFWFLGVIGQYPGRRTQRSRQ